MNGSAPYCEHADGLVPVRPRPACCTDCAAAGTSWPDLLVCLTCGWVACSNESPNRHACAHYEETDHPVAGSLVPGSTWRWCYVHRRRV